MNNSTTSEICINNFNYDKFLHISNIIWQIFGLLSVIIGVPGHFFQIILSSNKINRKEPTSLYFVAIAICELVLLLGLFWLWCVNISIIKIDPRQIFSCGIFYNIIVGSATLSNIYLASMSIDRSIIILYPTRYRLIVTRSHVTQRLLLIYIIVFIFLIPHHFYLFYKPNSTLFLCDFRSSVNHKQIYLWTFIHAILFVSIPSIIVCISAFILLHNRCQHKRIHKNNLSSNARRMHRQSIFIFFVSLGIFFTLLPSCILEIFIVYDRFSYHKNNYCLNRWKFYKILLNCFVTLLSINYSMKFYIHLIISPSFRKNFIQLISCKTNQNLSRSSQINNENKNKQRLLSPIIEN